MSISDVIKESIEKSSWIRKMFEEGARLKEQYGDENVFDFSLGNPDIEPPEDFYRVLSEISADKSSGRHGYMHNSGFLSVRESIAKKVSSQHSVKLNSNSIVMTCGAAGGMNIILKTILNPDEEVIVIKPYFVEYGFYISNHQGKIIEVNSAEDFSIDLEAINKAITSKTRAVIINSPNNPTGKVYKKEEILKLGQLLEEKSNNNHPIFLISDEPYRELVYGKISVSPIFPFYKNSIIVTSYSKSLSLPGERIGYVAVNPEISEHSHIMAGLNFCNRIIGFVNAPALMQRVVERLNDATVNISLYQKRRDILIKGLRDGGYKFSEPEGAFYIFCKAPIDDDIDFVRHLQKFNILVVPGSGFGGPGYFRIAYCVPDTTITKAIPKFKEALNTYKKE